MDVNLLRVYLSSALDAPPPVSIPEFQHVLHQTDLRSHVGAYCQGFIDGTQTGHKVAIEMVLDYLEEES